MEVDTAGEGNDITVVEFSVLQELRRSVGLVTFHWDRQLFRNPVVSHW